MLVIVLKIVLIAVVLPVLLSLGVDSARRASGTQNARWTFKNIYFWLTLLVIVIVSTIEVQDYRSGAHTLREDKPLKYFALSDYVEELDALGLKDSSWQGNRQSLLRKFEHANYAYESGGFQEALQSLLSLENGKDMLGPLQQIPSFVVANNIACVYFKIQRNKEFQASQHFTLARSRVDPAHPNWQVVEQNLNTLDLMANSLD